jgi:hypothetical protein
MKMVFDTPACPYNDAKGCDLRLHKWFEELEEENRYLGARVLTLLAEVSKLKRMLKKSKKRKSKKRKSKKRKSK